MNSANIIDLLINAGFENVYIKGRYIFFQDPSCIYPAFDAVLYYAWIVVMFLLGIMLFGWALLYIKNGVKLDTLFNNAKTILLILFVLASVRPIVNFVYGENLFAKQCEIKSVSLATVNELLNARAQTIGEYDAYILNGNE